MKNRVILAVAAVACTFCLRAEEPRVIAALFVDADKIESAAQNICDGIIAVLPPSQANLKRDIAQGRNMVIAGAATIGLMPGELEWVYATVGGDLAQVDDDGIAAQAIAKFRTPAAAERLVASLPLEKAEPVDGIDVYTVPRALLGGEASISYAVRGDTILAAAADKDSLSPLADLIRSEQVKALQPPPLEDGCVARVVVPEYGRFLKTTAGRDIVPVLGNYAALCGDPDLVKSVTDIGDIQLDVYLTPEMAGVKFVAEAGTEYDAEFIWHALSYTTMFRRYALDLGIIAVNETLQGEFPQPTIDQILAKAREIRPLLENCIYTLRDGRKVGIVAKLPVLPLVKAGFELAGIVENAQNAAKPQLDAVEPDDDDDDGDDDETYPDE